MTEVTTRSRVAAGVPTGGEFAVEKREENEDLLVSDAMVRDARIGALLDEDGSDAYRVENLVEIDSITAEVSEPEPVGDSKLYRAALTNPMTGVTADFPVRLPARFTDPEAADILNHYLAMERERREKFGMDFIGWANEHDYGLSGQPTMRDALDDWQRMNQLPEFLGEDYGLYLWGATE